MQRAERSSSSPGAVVVVGASAGGVEALRTLVASLPAGLPAVVLVVLHVPATGLSTLPAILDRAGPLPVRHAVDGDLLVAGQVLVAPPDRHLEVVGDRVSLTTGPHENGQRPSVDALFRTAARAHEHRVVSVVLSGALHDGAAGTLAVLRNGGHALVQEPAEAGHAGMPLAAIAAGPCEVLRLGPLGDRVVDLVVDLAVDLAAALTDPTAPAAPQSVDRVATPGEQPEHGGDGEDRAGGAEGAGPLVADGVLLRGWGNEAGRGRPTDAAVRRQSVAMENALWMALRGLEEKAMLNHDLAERSRERGSADVAERFEAAAREAADAAGLIRRLVGDLGTALDPTGPARPDTDVGPA
jgi:two-component system chemotaxis response regulator CheB